MRLIDADALITKLKEKYDFNKVDETALFIALDIKNAPTVEQTIEKWIPIESRPMDEDERKEYSYERGYELEDDEAIIYTSQPPDYGQDVLISLRNGNIMLDTFEDDGYGCYFSEYGEMDGVIAWMPLPEPYEEAIGWAVLPDPQRGE